MVARLWPDSTVVCAASGPSLTRDDLEVVRGKAKLLAVSDGIRLCADFADALYATDQAWWVAHQGVPAFTGPKFAVSRLRHKRSDIGFGVTVLKNTGDAGIETSPDGVRTGLNSGAAAVNLAVHLGAKRIVLLGYDMHGSRGRRHFFGDHPPRLSNSSNYQRFIQMFATKVAALRELGVDVVNCTPGSRLTCFPMRPLREVFADTAVAA